MMEKSTISEITKNKTRVFVVEFSFIKRCDDGTLENRISDALIIKNC